MFPEDSLQSLIKPDPWWIKNENRQFCRGALIFSFAPHVDQTPYCFEPIGRTEATEHGKADVKVSPLRVDQPLKPISLPVAAMPVFDKEVWAAYRAKKRPCLVFALAGDSVDKMLTRGKPNQATAATFLAAPFYGVDQNEKRAGYNPQFVERVRHCEYQQFYWDKLPISGANESILRLDHLQPIGAHHNAYKVSDHMLSPVAMGLLDDILRWFIWGGVPKDSMLHLYRELIETTYQVNLSDAVCS